MSITPYRIERGLRTRAGVRGALAVPAVLLLASLGTPLNAQMHKVSPPQNVVRAVAVYEWTGDMAKPTASRLIPMSIFIDGQLRDAAVYLARPVPLALDTGNVYEIDRAGIAVGTVDVVFARHLVEPDNATTNYDDGWFGYGKFIPPAPPNESKLKPSKTLVAINGLDDDDDQPHFSARSAAPGSGGAATPAPGTSAPSETPADDPDRPVFHRSASDQTSSSSSGGTPADDPDRPTLRRHSPEDAKNSAAGQPGGSDDVPSLNNDPNRPILHYGKPEGALTEADVPKLTGLPSDQDLHQMVAVSDAVDRQPHDFSRAWESEAEHQAMLATMEAAAHKLLASYEAANWMVPAANAPTASSADVPSAAPTPAKTRRASGKQTRSALPETPLPPPEPLLDEQLRGYMLSYSGPATYVYTAQTGGLDSTVCYVTLVAQDNMEGKPEISIQSVTDAAHLDRTPRMRLVDAVDAEASNRASLLFELRMQKSRQFALYRVIGTQAVQTYLSGTTD